MRSVLFCYRLILGAAFLMVLAACSGAGSQQDLRDSALYAYSSAIRWGHIDEAWSMVDPDYAREHPLSRLERERFDQVEITGYLVKGVQPISEDELVQLVEIRVVNRHSMAERTIQDRQHWRWDKAAKRWWLLSGLPVLTGGSR